MDRLLIKLSQLINNFFFLISSISVISIMIFIQHSYCCVVKVHDCHQANVGLIYTDACSSS